MTARDLALIAVFAAFIAALGTAGTLTPVGDAAPITAQTLGVMLAGSILGGRRGALAVLTFLVLVAAGLPLLAPSPSRPSGGLGVFTGLTGGFLAGWVAGAWVIGRLVELGPRRFVVGWIAVANVIGGIVVVYAFGVPVMAWVTGMSLVHTLTISAIYLPGDLIKVVATAVVARGVHRGYPVLARQLDRSAGATR
jgi:biotin transport system substrate-specific component